MLLAAALRHDMVLLAYALRLMLSCLLLLVTLSIHCCGSDTAWSPLVSRVAHALVFHVIPLMRNASVSTLYKYPTSLVFTLFKSAPGTRGASHVWALAPAAMLITIAPTIVFNPFVVIVMCD